MSIPISNIVGVNIAITGGGSGGDGGGSPPLSQFALVSESNVPLVSEQEEQLYSEEATAYKLALERHAEPTIKIHKLPRGEVDMTIKRTRIRKLPRTYDEQKLQEMQAPAYSKSAATQKAVAGSGVGSVTITRVKS